MIDFWSLGVIFFELVNGVSPFYDEHPNDIFGHILNYKDVLPSLMEPIDESEMSLNAKNFVNSLICEPEVRLGRNGLEDFRSHPFFEGFDWEHIHEMIPPFIPQVFTHRVPFSFVAHKRC